MLDDVKQILDRGEWKISRGLEKDKNDYIDWDNVDNIKIAIREIREARSEAIELLQDAANAEAEILRYCDVETMSIILGEGEIK